MPALPLTTHPEHGRGLVYCVVCACTSPMPGYKDHGPLAISVVSFWNSPRNAHKATVTKVGPVVCAKRRIVAKSHKVACLLSFALK